MEKTVSGHDLVLLMDDFSEESRKLYTSFRMAGIDCPVVVLEENGFLPKSATSVYGWFLGDFKNVPDSLGRPRYFNQINVPDYWEISGNNRQGKVSDCGRERGRIFYAEPLHKRLVRIVDWMDEKGIVRSSDHYNRYGALFARTTFNAKGQRFMRTYFSADGKEKIVENFVTKDIIVNDGEQVRFFKNKTELAVYVLQAMGLARKRICYNTLSTSFFVSERLRNRARSNILFWQEAKREDIPGNMLGILDGKNSYTCAIMVQKKVAFDKLLELGANSDVLHLLGFIYPFKRKNALAHDALICTNSDNIAHCTTIIEALPNLNFHIAAITEMSSKLLALGEFENVTLYPNVKMPQLDRLFESCDWYFDINHENEIVSAVKRAFLQNQLIFGFEETAHNRDYVADEHLFAKDDVERLISEVRAILENEVLMEEHLKLQRQFAQSESPEAYGALLQLPLSTGKKSCYNEM